MKFINGVTDYDEWRDHDRDNKKFKERMSKISWALAKKENGERLTLAEQIVLVLCIVVSELSGKLEGFYAISTSVLMNAICQARAKVKNSICALCYAALNIQRKATLTQALETNFIILNTFLISEEAWKVLAIPSTNGMARIESHGDVATEICAINYVRIVASHPWLTFAVFTKNVELYKNVFETEGKPSNMIFIASSPIINEVMDIPEWAVEYVDHIFTVYEEEYAREHGIVINCGTWEGHDLDHRCSTCMKCYDKQNVGVHCPFYYLNELLHR